MKRSIKSFSLVMLALLMLVSSVACGNNQPVDESAAAVDTSAPASTEVTKEPDSSEVAQVGQAGKASREFQPVPEGDWKQPYATTVNITTVKVRIRISYSTAGTAKQIIHGQEHGKRIWASRLPMSGSTKETPNTTRS